mmetsp:Transcript_15083/g.44007  ORF Transcript_15083/g.44007 Transcript_15083/m.44007 type:complete len:390 (+) Transcript_15083:53-1222(+)
MARTEVSGLDHSLHSLSQALTEVSHLSAFTVSSRAPSVRLSLSSGSLLPTPRVTEGWPGTPLQQLPSSASSGCTFGSSATLASGSMSARPLRAPLSRRRAMTGCSSGTSGDGSMVTEANSSSCPSSSTGFARRYPVRPASSTRRSRSSSKEVGLEDTLDFHSLAASSLGGSSTLAGTSVSTLSDLTMTETSVAALCPDAVAGAARRPSRPSSAPAPSPARPAECAASPAVSSTALQDTEARGGPRQSGRAAGAEDLLDILVRRGSFEFIEVCSPLGTPSCASRRQLSVHSLPGPDAAPGAAAPQRRSPRPLSGPSSHACNSGRQDETAQPPQPLDIELLRSCASPSRTSRCAVEPLGRTATPPGGVTRAALGRSATLKGIGRTICRNLT